jgi:hypothetical protein
VGDTNITMTAATATTPVTREDLLARLRVELHDEDENSYRWEDATLQRHLERAVRELSQVWPRERKSTLETTAGARDISVSGLVDLVRVEAVEWPAGNDPATYVRWSLYDEVLTLLGDHVPAAAEDAYVFWGSLHTLDDEQSTLPAVTEESVVQGAAGYAALEWANYAINRANVGGADAWEDYRRWGDQQIESFREGLQEFGKRARVRTSALFRPAGGPLGRDVVRWE